MKAVKTGRQQNTTQHWLFPFVTSELRTNHWTAPVSLLLPLMLSCCSTSLPMCKSVCEPWFVQCGLHFFVYFHFVPNLLQVSELGCFLDSALSRGVVRRQFGVCRVCRWVTGTRGAPSTHMVLVGSRHGPCAIVVHGLVVGWGGAEVVKPIHGRPWARHGFHIISTPHIDWTGLYIGGCPIASTISLH